jgi:peptidoglycan-binding protein CsiV
MTSIRALFAFLLAITASYSYGAAVQDIEDLLDARWFEVEVIVFERLDVLDVNADETLTQTKPRSWPSNLTLIGKPITPLDDQDKSSLALDTPYCLGYPELPEEDPQHPILQGLLDPRTNSFSDADDLDSAQRRGNEANTDDAADTTDAAENELTGTTLPRNTPQLKLTPYLQFLADVAAFEKSLFTSSLQWLPDLALTAEVKALNRQRHLRPVIHKRWRQPIPARDRPQPIYVSSEFTTSAPGTSAGFAKIEGYISVTVGRYLHFAPTLWYHADTLGVAPVPLPVMGPLPELADNRYFVLSESRRMRSAELHYLDHPKLGVLVRIDPVELPDELAARQETLNGTQDALQ